NLTGVDFHGPEFSEPIAGTVDLHRHDVYRMMIIGFSNIWVSAFYVLGVGLLCVHLSHGASAMFQSLGWKNKVYGPCLDKGARIAAVLIFLGYISIPVAILLGFGKEALK